MLFRSIDAPAPGTLTSPRNGRRLLLAARKNVIKIVVCSNAGGPRGMGQATIHTGIMNHLGNQTRPPGLMRSSETVAGVAVEKLVEEDIVAPMDVVVEHIASAIAGPAAVIVSNEDVLQAVLKLLGHLAKVHKVAGSSGTFNLELVSVKHVEPQQRFDQKKIDAKPDRLRDEENC